MRTNLFQSVRHIYNYLKTFLPIFLGIETFLNYISYLLENIFITDLDKFSLEYGVFTFIYIWIIFPVTLTLFLTNFKNYLSKNHITFFNKKNIIITAVTVFLLVGGTLLSYKDRYTTRLTIVTTKQVRTIIVESSGSDEKYKFDNLLSNNNEYKLPKRIPYGGYKITIQYKKGEDTIRFRTFDSRSKELKVFER